MPGKSGNKKKRSRKEIESKSDALNLKPPAQKKQKIKIESLKNEEQRVLIKNIGRGSTRHHVIAKVISKGRKYETNGKAVCSVVIADEDSPSSFIELQLQGDAANAAHRNNGLKFDHVYRFSGFGIEKVFIQKPVCDTHKFRLLADNEAFRFDEQHDDVVTSIVPQLMLPKLTPLSDLKSFAQYQHINVTGFVTEVGALRRTKSDKPYRTLLLVHDENASTQIRVTVWGPQAQNLTPEIVHRQWVAVLFGQVKLSEKYGDGITIEEGVHSLREYDGSNLELKTQITHPLQVETGSLYGNVVYKELTFAAMKQLVLESKLEKVKKGACVFRAILSDYIDVNADSNEYYIGPKNSKWPKKLTLIEDDRWKDSANVVYDKDQIAKVYQFKVCLSDPSELTNTIKALVFNSGGQSLFNGLTADDVCGKKEDSNTENEFWSILDEADGLEYEIKAQIKEGLIIDSFALCS